MKTKERLETILESAKEEFLLNGFEHANMRTIAKKANLSTGSLYNRFSDKEALFTELVEPYATEFIEMYRNGNDKGEEALKLDNDISDMNIIALQVCSSMIDYMYAHQQSFELIINCSKGSKYEDYIEKIIEIEEERTYATLLYLKDSEAQCQILTREEVHMIVTAQLNAMFEVIRHNSPKEVALSQIINIYLFFMNGWAKIFEG